jgi:excisionase family DNA binding protein
MSSTEQRPRVYSIKLAAKALSLSERTLFRLIADGKIRTILLGERRRGIPATELDRIEQSGIQ